MEIDAEVADRLFQLKVGDFIDEWRKVALQTYEYRGDHELAWMVVVSRRTGELWGVPYIAAPDVRYPWKDQSGPVEMTPLHKVKTVSYLPRKT